MSQFYVSGPCQVFTGTGSGAALEFLGYSESGVTVSIEGIFEDVAADYAGGMPADISMLGQTATISGLFVRYNEIVVNKSLAFINGATPGVGASLAIGTLLATEGGAIPLVLYSPYSFKSAYTGTMVPGFAFAATYLSQPYEVGLSVRNKKTQLTWRAFPVFASQPYLSYGLYTNTIPSLPNVN